MEERQAAQEYFLSLLQTVLGKALVAAGYHLERRPLQWAGGRYRFAKTLDDGCLGQIEFQVLVYGDSMWSRDQPSRFNVLLGRSCRRSAIDDDADQIPFRSLSRLIVRDFGVKILPAEDHWWRYHDRDSLAGALAEAGYLIVGYGMPWLAGELLPPSS